MSDKSINLLANSISTFDSLGGEDLAPGKVGALPSFLSALTAGDAAKLVENLLVQYAGDAAKAFVEAEHEAIARFVSPKLADFAAELIAEFGTKVPAK